MCLAGLWLACQGGPAEELQTGKDAVSFREPVERSIGSGEAHRYSVSVPSEQVTELIVDQLGIDVSVALLDERGESVLEMDSPIGVRGQESLLVLGAGRNQPFEIRASTDQTTPGRYRLYLFEPKDRSPSDELRLSAQQAHWSGRQEETRDGKEPGERALEHYRRALSDWRSSGDRRYEAYAVVRMGDVLRGRLERPSEALELFQEAQEIQTTTGDEAGLAVTAYFTARALQDLGRREAAMEHFSRAREIALEVGDRTVEGAAEHSLGAVLYELGRKEEALAQYERALSIFQEIGLPLGQANALSDTGSVYDSFGQPERALGFYERVLAILETLESPYNEAVILNNTAAALDKMGEKQEALRRYNRALAILERIDLLQGIGYVENNLARLYSGLGDHEAARHHYLVALEAMSVIEHRGGVGSVLSNLGGVHLELGELDEADQRLREALAVRREVGDRRGEGLTMKTLADLRRRQDDAEGAMEHYTGALEISREIGDRRGEGYALIGMSRVHEAEGEQPLALELYRDALRILRGTRDPQGEAMALLSIARTQRDQGALAEALKTAEDAVGIIESIRLRVGSSQLRSSFFASSREYYELLVDLRMELEAQEPGAGHLDAAFQASERARARSLLETLLERRASFGQGAAPELLDRERSLMRRLRSRNWELARHDGSKDDEQRDRLANEIRELVEELRELRGEIRVRNPRYAELMEPRILSIAELRGLLSTDDTLLLEYALGSERSFLWVVDRTSLTAHELPAAAEIERLARRFATQARESHKFQAAGAARRAARELTNVLLDPVAPKLEGKRRLIFVADGALHYVPFAALLAPGRTLVRRPLVVDYDVLMLPSASVLGLLRDEKITPRDQSHLVAVVADPVFQADDPRVGRISRPIANPSPGTGSEDRAKVRNAAEALGLDGFERLPFSRREAVAIQELLNRRAFLALDFDASLETVRGGALEGARVLHFATHGVLDSTHPELSGLVLSLVDENGHERDGFLTMHEVFSLPLSPELVVLSACQTALGQEIRGEGLVGLTRGFMYSGATGIIASLWPIDDQATGDLMEIFYQGLLEEGLPPPNALRRAQLSMWKRKPTEAPYFWAGFVYLGDGQTLRPD